MKMWIESEISTWFLPHQLPWGSPSPSSHIGHQSGICGDHSGLGHGRSLKLTRCFEFTGSLELARCLEFTGSPWCLEQFASYVITWCFEVIARGCKVSWCPEVGAVLLALAWGVVRKTDARGGHALRQVLSGRLRLIKLLYTEVKIYYSVWQTYLWQLLTEAREPFLKQGLRSWIWLADSFGVAFSYIHKDIPSNTRCLHSGPMNPALQWIHIAESGSVLMRLQPGSGSGPM